MLEKRIKQYMVVLVDFLLISLSLFISYALRFNSFQLERYYDQILITLPFILAVRLTIFVFMGLYRGMWRFVGMRDLVTLVKAITLGSIVSVVLLFLLFRLHHYPRSVFIIDWFVLLVLMGGSRFSYRLYREGKIMNLINLPGKEKTGKRVLIVGAGRAGELILREMLGNYRTDYQLIGFVDDDRRKFRMTIHGFPVLGHTRDIPKLVKKHIIDDIFLAIPSAPTKARRRIMRVCKSARVKFKTLPSLGALLDGKIKVSDLHEFQIEDLLGRKPAHMDTALIAEYIRDKTVMITGAGGSIGSELCRQVAQFSPKKLVLFENSEFNLYQIEMSLLEMFPDLEIHPIIGNVLNQRKVKRALNSFRPEVVFHAAAYKHVPLMELNFEEALANNCFGTWVMASQSRMAGVKKFVFVSTDKAVRPTNIMGASKRIAELICQGFGQGGDTQFVTVRFGNVLNSVGSVIPLFKRQIAKGGPVTVTHPDIYRYFMTIPEAVQLIMQAGAMGQGGEIFILDMGEPVRILDLARDIITLSGLEPEKDIRIVFTGLRPGEKLYEELLTAGEEVKSTLHEKIKVVAGQKMDWPSVIEKIEHLLNSLEEGMQEHVFTRVKEIVPEFQPENAGCKADHIRKDTYYEVFRTGK